ncbi:bifunctional protein FolD 2 isoform X1 [Selaginella moellendorffii]|uniref:bifunctional protein FolD 2 isoform X1 n=1 Tax=Selaginella moellendorffii TaxID=88036 RepID=UPI000D1CF403|nr:bifunctional protein FolD 2 isoform X1 [Selaginella moellendorffii]|eukprot:XP_024541963.1 bifunctional protein FolD 2 isoform X1 [Selaginella moellendorffii]
MWRTLGVRSGFSNPSRSCHKHNSTMPAAAARRMDGRLIAQEIKDDIAETIRTGGAEVGFARPGLAVLQVGDSPQSQAYIHNLRTACTEVGIKSFASQLPETATLQAIIQALRTFNGDESVHGIVVQLPLPKVRNHPRLASSSLLASLFQKIRPETVLQEISLEKDVDGLHPLNLAKLALDDFQPSFVPCTSRACLELLTRYKFQVERRKVVVIGCSNVVGLPTALLLQRHNATVTIVDKHTPKPAEIARTADILVAATGNANLVRRNWIKPGAVVIDIGMNQVKDPSSEEGFRFVGDVCYEEAEKVATAITPVPGGVGPITIAMVLSNTLLAAQRRDHAKRKPL